MNFRLHEHHSSQWAISTYGAVKEINQRDKKWAIFLRRKIETYISNTS